MHSSPQPIFILIIIYILHLHTANALDNGLASTPALGWNSWNLYACDIDEDLIKSMADAMVDSGLSDLGYEYINMDDCWQNGRDQNGNILADSEKFPSGIPALVDYVHSKGLKFGLYSDAGSKTCGGRPGSLSFEYQDATTYASWGVDYLKYDNCYNERVDLKLRYTTMRDALNSTGHPIYFSLCEWGVKRPWEWAGSVGNSWRTTDDVKDDWNQFVRVTDNSFGISKYAGPGSWNDMDMLEVGNGGMTFSEYQAHFAIWAVMKSPLIIGCDLTSMSAETKSILMNKELIDINQDALGVAGDLIKSIGPEYTIAGPLSDGSRVVVFWNRHTHDNAPKDEYWSTYDMSIKFTELGYMSGISCSVRDIYSGKELGIFKEEFTGDVVARGVLVVRITPVSNAMRDTAWRPWRKSYLAIQ